MAPIGLAPHPTDIANRIRRNLQPSQNRRPTHLQKIFRRRRKAGVRQLVRFCDIILRNDIGEAGGVGEELVPSRRRKNEDLVMCGRRICPEIRSRFIIYGSIGEGTFGYILAARERDCAPGTRPKQYALKLETDGSRSHFGIYSDINPNHRHFVPTEAAILQLLSGSPRFPPVDSVYICNEFSIIVMSADSVEDCEERYTLPDTVGLPRETCFPGYSGEQLFCGKTPRLTEIQVCKVMSQILEGMMYLMDMNMSHDDLSHRNYLVDENLNAQLIDFGMTYLADGSNPSDWEVTNWVFIKAFESMLSPEIAFELAKRRDASPSSPHGQLNIRHQHDIRQQHLWRYGVMLYDLLHGYAPWEPPKYDPGIGEVKFFHCYEKTERMFSYMRERRHRIVNEELPVDENLSQDCVDVLRALLAREVVDRPSLFEIVSFPWFQGQWVDYPAEQFRRPPFLPAWEEPIPPPPFG